MLAIVAEKTGYPVDMLDLDLDLEADLGIDTVKQAEMFASVRAAFNIPRDANLKLRDFPTLAHVIQFAQDRAPASEAAPVAEVEPAGRQCKPAPRIPPSFEAADRVPRRVPAPRMRPPLDLCKPTGVTLGPGSRVVLMPDQGGVGEALEQRLQSMGVEVLRIDGAPDAESLAGRLERMAGGRTGDRSLLAARAGPRRKPQRHECGLLARSSSCARQIALHDDARAVPAGGAAGHVPGVGDAARRAARLRRGRSRRADGRRRGGLHQNLQARAGGSPREGGRFRSGVRTVRSGRHPDRGDPARPRRGGDRTYESGSAGRSASNHSPSPTANPA